MKSLNRRTLVKSLAAGSLTSLASKLSAQSTPLPSEIEADVCVLGAGASGMFAAMRLRELGYKVVILEKEGRVGGHAYTYEDRHSGLPTEMGVRFYPDLPIIRETFQKYGIALREVKQAGARKIFVDLSTGQESSYLVPSVESMGQGLVKFNALRDLHYPYLNEPGFNLPSQIADELFSPFKDFLNKHALSAGYPALSTHLMGRGKAGEVQTFYALKALRKDIVENTMQDSFLTTEQGAQAIYQVMASQLGEDLILGARIDGVHRKEGHPIQLRVSRADASVTNIKAGKIIVAFPPQEQSLRPFDLDETEQRFLTRFRYKYYWTALVRTEGLPPDLILLNNKGPNPEDESLFADQVYPGIFIITPTMIPGLTNVLYGSDEELSEERVKLNITGDLERLNGSFTTKDVSVSGFDAFLSHTPFSPTVSNSAIKRGFYCGLQKLQGYRGTYYTGAAFDINDTSSVWLHAKGIVESNFPLKDS